MQYYIQVINIPVFIVFLKEVYKNIFEKGVSKKKASAEYTQRLGKHNISVIHYTNKKTIHIFLCIREMFIQQSIQCMNTFNCIIFKTRLVRHVLIFNYGNYELAVQPNNKYNR